MVWRPLAPWCVSVTAVGSSSPPTCDGRRVVDADGRTLRSATGCRTAHSEHTIAITDDGAEILTLPPGSWRRSGTGIRAHDPGLTTWRPAVVAADAWRVS